ncbi:hypothetical protein [Spirulina subsalsa]|uniref:hypothetical protein n=1 Tax=Spirulina subsalsa TaxID=54311 RepID=UPI0002E35C72|nr:hypothetical protein [Spirulina subsalsa]
MSSPFEASLTCLQGWCAGHSPTTEDYQQLASEILADSEQAQAFGITSFNVLEEVKWRSQIFSDIYPQVWQLCQEMGFPDQNQVIRTLWILWLPLTLQLVAERQKLERPIVQGILGGQGSGKTTLTAVIRLILEHLNYTSVGFSLDDLYKSYVQRQQLQQQDPRLIWRGPPGTHDVEIGVELLDGLRQPKRRKPVIVPRFDKSAWGGAGDKATPEMIDPVDIVLFEGWFVGVRPIDPREFDQAPPPIITPEDRHFAWDMNDRLMEYVPLWHRLDRLMILYPVDYRFSKQWRREAEHKMKAQGKGGMSDEELEQFVEYFWRSLHPDLFIRPLIHNSILTDLVVEINEDHTVGRIYQPT